MVAYDGQHQGRLSLRVERIHLRRVRQEGARDGGVAPVHCEMQRRHALAADSKAAGDKGGGEGRRKNGGIKSLMQED